jgi:hypothetical protein
MTLWFSESLHILYHTSPLFKTFLQGGHSDDIASLVFPPYNPQVMEYWLSFSGVWRLTDLEDTRPWRGIEWRLTLHTICYSYSCFVLYSLGVLLRKGYFSIFKGQVVALDIGGQRGGFDKSLVIYVMQYEQEDNILFRFLRFSIQI